MKNSFWIGVWPGLSEKHLEYIAEVIGKFIQNKQELSNGFKSQGLSFSIKFIPVFSFSREFPLNITVKRYGFNIMRKRYNRKS